MPDADPPVSLPDTDRQYHIDLAPGEVADYILLPGDPDRTDRIASLLDDDRGAAPPPRVQLRDRHATAGCASRSSPPASVRTTSEIVMAEILAITRRPTFVRIGSCGVLREDIASATWSSPPAPLRLEATTSLLRRRRLPGGRRLRGRGRAPGGRRAHRPPCPPRPDGHGARASTAPRAGPSRSCRCASPTSPTRMAAQGVVNFEMEASAVLVAGGPGGLPRRRRLHRLRAAHQRRVRLAAEQRQRAEAGLHRDRPGGPPRAGRDGRAASRAGELHWRPSHWVPKMAL